MSTDVPFTDGVVKEDLGTDVPQCIKDLPVVDPTAPPLTKAELKEARKDLIVDKFVRSRYLRAIRTRVDSPVSGQVYSVICFTPSNGASPDKDGCFGVLKVRGNYPTPQEADERAEHLVVSDSINVNLISWVGREFPLCVDTGKYVTETKDVDIKSKLDTVAKESFKRNKEKEQKEIEEVKDRQKKLVEESEYNPREDVTTLEHYTQNRQKYGDLKSRLVHAETKAAEYRELLEPCIAKIKELETKNPTYYSSFLERYTNALKEVGVDERKLAEIPLMKYIRDEFTPTVVPVDTTGAGSSMSSSTLLDKTDIGSTSSDSKTPVVTLPVVKLSCETLAPPKVSITETPSGMTPLPLQTKEQLDSKLKEILKKENTLRRKEIVEARERLARLMEDDNDSNDDEE